MRLFGLKRPESNTFYKRHLHASFEEKKEKSRNRPKKSKMSELSLLSGRRKEKGGHQGKLRQ
jgi:hypothetical protein